ncbi:MAG: mechanosensitive ion channel, partial [Candidatus Diapherotrites archaeon]|nr:mechanosensitive ion channel [Candidatus Diapherotrites archaeon]
MLDTIILGNSIEQYLWVIIYFLGAFVGSKVVYFFLKNIVGAFAAKTQTKFDDVLLDLIEEPLVALIVIFGVYFGIIQLTLPGGIFNAVNNLFFITVVAVVTWFTLRLSEAFFKYWLAPLAEKTSSTVDDQLLPVAGKVVKVVVITAAVITILSQFGYDVSALVAGLGIGGLAIAMASKDYLSNIIG